MIVLNCMKKKRLKMVIRYLKIIISVMGMNAFILCELDMNEFCFQEMNLYVNLVLIYYVLGLVIDNLILIELSYIYNI